MEVRGGGAWESRGAALESAGLRSIRLQRSFTVLQKAMESESPNQGHL